MRLGAVVLAILAVSCSPPLLAPGDPGGEACTIVVGAEGGRFEIPAECREIEILAFEVCTP